MEIKNASEATEKALSFLMEKYPLRSRIAKPVKTSRENNLWIVELNIGIVRVLIATMKIDAVSGEILEYNIPPVGEQLTS
ncbi:MAG TPA: hypothetical protein EYP22_10520 [Methanosarcinales archaeon]|nr:hypothetical protein [Methanosarcinales archaeon]